MLYIYIVRLPDSDIIGKKFGRLTVIACESYIYPSGRKARKFICSCSCGNKTSVLLYDLLNKKTRSCKCLSREMSLARSTTHAMSKTAEYKIWAGVIKRCTNKNDLAYKLYGMRGITVCERWKNSFENFFADMGMRPSPKHSIDRIDNNGNYEPGNCRWATTKEQSRNTRRTLRIEFNGKVQCVADWAKELGVNRSSLLDRIQKLNWPIEKVLTQPMSTKYRSKK